MLNQKSIHAVNKNIFEKIFRKPDPNYCFKNIPDSIFEILSTGKQKSLPNDVFKKEDFDYDNVILILIDAMGWNSLLRNKDSDAFRFLNNNSVISKLTSQFPATTAAEVTTMHTGIPVSKHGIFEWFYYEPKIDEIIAPIIFSYAGDKNRETLKSKIEPKLILPKQTFYKKLNEKNIETHIVCLNDYIGSSYSSVVFNGGRITGFKTLEEGLGKIESIIKQKGNKKKYVNLYYGNLDTAGHNFGPGSKEFNEELVMIINNLKRFCAKIKKTNKKTLVLITADHGQKQINLNKTQYINLLFPEIIPYLKVNKNGTPIVFAGSPRDMFLYIKNEFLEETKSILEQGLKNVLVIKTDDLIKQNFFGVNNISNDLKQRLGNLVIFPTKDNGVWWYEKSKFELNYKGHHGGLLSEEMEIPLIVVY